MHLPAYDIPFELYSISSDNNMDFLYKESYTSQSTVLEYMQYLSDKYRLDSHFCFGRKSHGIDLKRNRMYVDVNNRTRGILLWYTHVISTVRQMHLNLIPSSINGANTFQGDSFQSSQCTRSLESFQGKRVTVVGNGASTIQVID